MSESKTEATQGAGARPVLDTAEAAPPTGPAEQKALTAEIAQTRADLGVTLGALEQRLAPAQIGVQLDQVEARVKAVVKEGLQDARGLAEAKIQQAQDALHQELEAAKTAVKDQLHEAKELVTHGLSAARDTVKKDVQTAIDHTKQSIRGATLGRVEDLATEAGDFMNTTRDTLVDTIRQNPVPAALAGIGLAWLLMNRSTAAKRRSQASWGDDGARGYEGNGGGARPPRWAGPGDIGSRQVAGLGDAVSGAAHQVGDALSSAGTAVTGAAHDATQAARHAVDQGVDRVGRLVHDASDAAGQMIHSATDTAGHWAQQAQDAAGRVAGSARAQAMRAERSLESTYDGNPLALGAVALAVGAAVGYALPRTQREDELLGEVGHRVLDSASHMAEGLTHSLQQMTGDAGDLAKKALHAKQD